MQLGSPVDALSASLYHAAYVALPDTHYEIRDLETLNTWPKAQKDEARKSGAYPIKKVVRRPDATECSVIGMFPQTWGSTALGFGGLGGAAMTPAYTVIVQGPGKDFAVYWGGRFAYLVPKSVSGEQLKNWTEDATRSHTVCKSEAEARYGAILDTAQRDY